MGCRCCLPRPAELWAGRAASAAPMSAASALSWQTSAIQAEKPRPGSGGAARPGAAGEPGFQFGEVGGDRPGGGSGSVRKQNPGRRLWQRGRSAVFVVLAHLLPRLVARRIDMLSRPPGSRGAWSGPSCGPPTSPGGQHVQRWHPPAVPARAAGRLAAAAARPHEQVTAGYHGGGRTADHDLDDLAGADRREHHRRRQDPRA